MATTKKRVDFLISEDGMHVRSILERMATDLGYNTDSTYSADAEQYPNNLIPFVDKHLNYLNSHPNVDVTQYLANLRLMTRVR